MLGGTPIPQMVVHTIVQTDNASLPAPRRPPPPLAGLPQGGPPALAAGAARLLEYRAHGTEPPPFTDSAIASDGRLLLCARIKRPWR